MIINTMHDNKSIHFIIKIKQSKIVNAGWRFAILYVFKTDKILYCRYYAT